MQKKRIEEALNQARKNKVVRFCRPYDGQAGDWLYNALKGHRRLPNALRRQTSLAVGLLHLAPYLQYSPRWELDCES